MRKVCFIAFIAIAAITLASFTTISHPPVKRPHKTVKKKAPSQPYNYQYDEDVTGYTFFDQCTGENIILSGTEHFLIHGVYNPDTNTLMEDNHVDFQGVSAVGATTGNKYQASFASNSSYVVSNTDCSVTFDAIATENYTTAGANNNFQIKYRYEYTYNFCSGTFTVTRNVDAASCQ